jgi:hypothetical protein
LLDDEPQPAPHERVIVGQQDSDFLHGYPAMLPAASGNST